MFRNPLAADEMFLVAQRKAVEEYEADCALVKQQMFPSQPMQLIALPFERFDDNLEEKAAGRARARDFAWAQQPNIAEQYAEQVIVVQNGQVLGAGTTREKAIAAAKQADSNLSLKSAAVIYVAKAGTPLEDMVEMGGNTKEGVEAIIEDIRQLLQTLIKPQWDKTDIAFLGQEKVHRAHMMPDALRPFAAQITTALDTAIAKAGELAR